MGAAHTHSVRARVLSEPGLDFNRDVLVETGNAPQTPSNGWPRMFLIFRLTNYGDPVSNATNRIPATRLVGGNT